MSTKTYTLISHIPGSESTSQTFIATQDALKALRVKAVAGARYELVDNATGYAPQQLQVKRVGKSLLIGLEQDHPEQSSLVLEEFYEVEDALLTGLAENGSTYPFIPDTANPLHAVDQLTDGLKITQVLGGFELAPLGAASPAVAGLIFSPALLGALGLGAAAIGAGGGGGDGDGGGGGAGGTNGGTDPSVTIASVATDQLINTAEAPAAEVRGTSNRPNTLLTLSATDGTNPPVTTTVTTAADGSWMAPMKLDGLRDGPITVTATLGTASDTENATKDTQAPQHIDASQVPAGGAPGEGQWTAVLNPASDSGIKGDLKTNDDTPTISGQGSPNDVITVRFPTGEVKEATVAADGTWTVTPDRPLSQGTADITIVARDPAGNSSDPVRLPLSIDTTGIGITVTQNFDALDTISANPGQALLNIAESANGVTYTIRLSEAPLNARGEIKFLALSDLTVAGASVNAASFTSNPEGTLYTVVLQPSANNAGTITLSVAADKFYDAAENPNAQASANPVLYDTIAPTAVVALNGAALDGSKILEISSDAISNLAAGGSLAFGARASADTQAVQLNFKDALYNPNPSTPTDGTWNFQLTKAFLETLQDGLHTMRYLLTDTAGNTGTSDLVIDRTSGIVQSTVIGTTGTSDSERFINGDGNQTFTGGGGSDTFFWLLRDKGTPGAPDLDRITDFVLGNPASENGNGDRLNLSDLIFKPDNNSLRDAFLRFEQFDTPGSAAGLDTTRILISHDGRFSGANTAAVVDQVIELQGVLTTLDQLTTNGQLII